MIFLFLVAALMYGIVLCVHGGAEQDFSMYVAGIAVCVVATKALQWFMDCLESDADE